LAGAIGALFSVACAFLVRKPEAHAVPAAH
jgi:hypothetical protein